MTLSTSRRLLHVVAAFGVIALMGGAVYGWPSMRQTLRREGALRSSSCDNVPVDEACNEQELSFGLVFTVGSWANQGGRLFVGIMLDRVGPRRTSFSCAVVCSIGAVAFALASNKLELAAGYFCIGVGGAGMQLSLQSVSALFPQNKGLVMAMLSGAFQAASVVFLLFETVHRLLDVSLRALMLGYAAVLVVAAVACLFIFPMKPYGVSAPKVTEKDTTVHLDAASVVVKTTESQKTSEVVPLDKRSFGEQVRSPEYLLMIFFFSITVLQAQFTIGSIGTQFEIKGDSGDLSRAFNLVFSLSWTITPLVGLMIDRFGYPCMLMIMNTVMLCSSACLLSPWRGLQYATAIFYTIGRVSIWATFFSFNGSVFGFKNYGKLVGGGLFVASCFSLLQYPILEVTLGTLDNEFAYVNGLWIALCVAMYPVIARLACHLRKPPITGGCEVAGKTDITVSDTETEDLGDAEGTKEAAVAAKADTVIEIEI